jgi:hypothetical protein
MEYEIGSAYNLIDGLAIAYVTDVEPNARISDCVPHGVLLRLVATEDAHLGGFVVEKEARHHRPE